MLLDGLDAQDVDGTLTIGAALQGTGSAARLSAYLATSTTVRSVIAKEVTADLCEALVGPLSVNPGLQRLVLRVPREYGSPRSRDSLPKKHLPSGRTLAELVAAGHALRDLSLQCGGTLLGDTSGCSFGTALRAHASLLHLDLRMGYTKMGDAAGSAFAAAVTACTSLISFNLDCFRTEMGDESGQAIASAVGRAPKLEMFSLNCHYTRMGDATGLALAEALQGSRVLRHFALTCNHTGMGDVAGCALAAAAGSSMLQRLMLDCEFTSMTDATGRAVASALARSSSLLDVELACAKTAGIGEPTGCALSAAAGSSTTLRRLVLRFDESRMGNETGDALAQAIRRSQSLREVQFCCGYPGRGGERRLDRSTSVALATACEFNVSLTSGRFSMWNFAGMWDIAAMWVRNRELQRTWWHLQLLLHQSKQGVAQDVCAAIGDFACRIMDFFALATSTNKPWTDRASPGVFSRLARDVSKRFRANECV